MKNYIKGIVNYWLALMTFNNIFGWREGKSWNKQWCCLW